MKFFVLLSAPMVLAACVSTPSVPAYQQAIADGGTRLDFQEIIGDNGVTFVATSGDWVNYLSPDGRKVVRINASGEATELTWRMDDTGTFCQQMFRTKKESCGNTILVDDGTGVVTSFDAEGQSSNVTFTLAPGNPENL